MLALGLTSKKFKKMKTRNIILLLVLILSSCDGELNYRYYTKLNPDGSVHKKIVAAGDSSRVYNNPFSFDVDEGWTVKYDVEINAEEGDTLHLAIAEKTFPSINHVNNDLSITDDSVHLDNITVDYQKRFRWFFTFHHYRETFLQRFPFKHVNINDYMTKAHLAYLVENDTTCLAGMTNKEKEEFDKEGEEKFYQFLFTSCACEYVTLLNNYAHEYKYSLLSANDSIHIIEMFNSFNDEFDIETIGYEINKQLNISWAQMPYDDGYLDRFEKQLDDEVLLLDEQEYVSVMELPGLLYATNAQAVDKNTVKWQFRRGRFFYNDFSMQVSYRTVNYWAIFLTVFVILLLMMYVFKMRKK